MPDIVRHVNKNSSPSEVTPFYGTDKQHEKVKEMQYQSTLEIH